MNKQFGGPILSPPPCLFCTPESGALAGSEEHVFLSSIGGRIVTRQLLCAVCNNAFSPWDYEVSRLCLLVRNALNIRSGRGEPPPTIRNACEDQTHPGVFFDLAPGLTPIPQPARIPSKADTTHGSAHSIVAIDMADVARVQDIFRKRKLDMQIESATSVRQQLPGFHYRIGMRIEEGFRSIAKLAVASACVLFDNATAGRCIKLDVRRAAREFETSIRPFVAFGYDLDWPGLNNKRPHARTPSAVPSDFDHSVVLIDVGDHWVGYVELFGAYRFVVALGPRTGLLPAALIINPMSGTCARMEADVTIPAKFKFPATNENDNEIARRMDAETRRALELSYSVGRTENAEKYADELLKELSGIGADEAAREVAIDAWAAKVAAIELGEAWTTPVDISFDKLGSL